MQDQRITRGPDRIVAVPALYIGVEDAELHVFTDDGERADIELMHEGLTVARGEGFRAPQIGPSLLEQSDESLASMFGGFLSHALESSEDDARDGWPVLTDASADWVDALALFGAES